MAGIDAALASVTTPVVVVLATDLPLVGTLPEGLVGALGDTGDGVRRRTGCLPSTPRGARSSSAPPIAPMRCAAPSLTAVERTAQSMHRRRRPSAYLDDQRHRAPRDAWEDARGRPDVGH